MFFFVGCVEAISIVNVSALMNHADPATAAALSKSFEETGFAVVVGHGVADETIQTLRSEALKFFASDSKFAYDKGLGYGHGGYVRFNESGAQLLGDFSKPVDLVESLTLSDLDTCGPPNLVEPARDFVRATRALSRGLARGLYALNISEAQLGAVADPDHPRAGLRLAFYPDQPGEPGQMRYGAHVDSFTLTVLNLDPANPHGLQVSIADAWVDVPFVQNSFVINVGALLSRWTRGKWKASVHRVLNEPGPRLSIVTSAIGVKLDAPPFAGFDIPDQPLLDPIDAKTYLENRVKLHRPDFAQQHGLQGDDLHEEARKIRSLHK